MRDFEQATNQILYYSLVSVATDNSIKSNFNPEQL